MSVLNMGSGTEGPACYLAQQFGCHVLGVDISTVGHEQAVARAHDAGISHLVPFRLGDIHTVALYLERRVEFEAIWRPERYQEGLERLQMSQHCATIDVLGQLACIAEQ
jgi:Methyltransferase domain